MEGTCLDLGSEKPYSTQLESWGHRFVSVMLTLISDLFNFMQAVVEPGECRLSLP